MLRQKIPVMAARAHFSIQNLDPTIPWLSYKLALAHLYPIEETLGVQQRLQNLGYPCETTGILDKQTKAAIAAFQEDHDLRAMGTINRLTQIKLMDVHDRGER